MTTQEYIDNLDSRIQKILDVNTYEKCFISHYGKIKARIEKGDIGGSSYNYSTTPIYVSNKDSVRAIKPRGKDGKAKKGAKSRYYPGGYKEHRGDVGLQNQYVDLQYSGDFMRDSSKIKREKDSFSFTVTRQINRDKLAGFINKYGNPFAPNTEENDELILCMQTRSLNILNA